MNAVQAPPMTPEVERMMGMLDRAVNDASYDPDKLEKVYQIFERMEKRAAEQMFSAAMVAAQSNAEALKRKHFNPQTRSYYVDLGQVAEEANRAFNDAGISLSFSEGATEKVDHMRVLCDLRHQSGHSEQRYLDMPVVTTGIKGTTMMTQTHATGAGTTYARRYLTLMLANLPTEKDTDGNEPQAMISDEQALKIDAYIQENELDRVRVMKWIKEGGGYTDINAIYARDFDKVMNGLKKLNAGP